MFFFKENNFQAPGTISLDKTIQIILKEFECKMMENKNSYSEKLNGKIEQRTLFVVRQIAFRQKKTLHK